MNHPAWLLIVFGLVLLAVGILWLVVPAVPWLGRLPGDIRIEGEHGRFYFPVTTCILLSLVLSFVLWVVGRISR